MSISFYSNVADERTELRPEPCLCSQLAPGWCYPATVTPELSEVLRKHASPDCAQCGGEGVELAERSDAPWLNWSNGNAASVFAALGINPNAVTQLSIRQARLAVEYAQRRPVPRHAVRAPQTFHGATVVRNGAVDVLPLRAVQSGLSVDDIRDRIEDFSRFVEECARRGATAIHWG